MESLKDYLGNRNFSEIYHKLIKSEHAFYPKFLWQTSLGVKYMFVTMNQCNLRFKIYAEIIAMYEDFQI